MKRTITLAVTLACAAAAHGQGMSHREYVAMRHCEQGNVRSCIHRAAIHRHIDYGQALYIAHRESRFDPSVCNYGGSGACGLYQFMPRTWAHTPYGRYSVFSAKWASLAYAWAISRGYSSWWAL